MQHKRRHPPQARGQSSCSQDTDQDKQVGLRWPWRYPILAFAHMYEYLCKKHMQQNKDGIASTYSGLQSLWQGHCWYDACNLNESMRLMYKLMLRRHLAYCLCNNLAHLKRSLARLSQYSACWDSYSASIIVQNSSRIMVVCNCVIANILVRAARPCTTSRQS